MTPFEKLIHELNKDKIDRKGFEYKRKSIFKVYDIRINELYNNYFNNINKEENCHTFIYNEEDLDDLLVLLRCHFKLWIEFNTKEITIYKHFPKKFKINKEVNKENHWFIPKVFKKGTIMLYTYNVYGTANRMNGIPLCESFITVEGTDLVPSFQINYDFIKPL